MKNFDIFGTQEIIQKKLPITLTFGNFDGVHLGHKFLISEILKTCPQPLVAMTFDPHPANFFKPHTPKKFLTTTQEKINFLLECGIDAIIVKKFTPSFALMSADEFCENFLAVNFNIHNIVLGYNLSYGKDRQGNFFHMQKFAKKFGWNVIQGIAFEDSPGSIVSSTRIRSAIENGEPLIAEKLLGKSYSISGTVFRGDGRGHKLGFPTANIFFDESKIIPHYGVYACEVEFTDKYPGKLFSGVMNCGIRPTFQSNTPKIQIETYILDFNEDVYEEKVIFHIKHFIRHEQKFGNLENLKEQLQKDVDFARTLII